MHCQVATNPAAERAGLRVGDILTEVDAYTLASAISAPNNSGKMEHTGDGGGEGGGGCGSSSLSSDSGDARGDIVRMSKQLIVGPRGKPV
jgi:hypothetical protein